MDTIISNESKGIFTGSKSALAEFRVCGVWVAQPENKPITHTKNQSLNISIYPILKIYK
ncbi:hypothetical protein MAH4_00120 [Sessilibacter sp. MAH4]